MHTAPLKTGIGVDEYLAGEQATDVRHEYLGGDVYAMGGASDVHNLICGNLFAALHAALRGGPCQVFMADMKVHFSVAGDDYFYYPDILVSCHPEDRARYYREHPILLVEVLSESTERVDRREKLFGCMRIPELQEYVLVTQDRAEIMVFRRDSGLEPERLGATDELRLSSLDFALPVAEVYRGVL